MLEYITEERQILQGKPLIMKQMEPMFCSKMRFIFEILTGVRSIKFVSSVQYRQQ